MVGIHIQTKPMSPEIPALWPRFVARIDEIENPAEPNVSYGVMWHGGTMDVLHYLAAVSVNAPNRIPAGMETLTLAGADYASFKYPLSKLGEGFCEIYQRLLPASNFVTVPAPYFERYDEAFDPRNMDSLVEICMRVKPRS